MEKFGVGEFVLASVVLIFLFGAWKEWRRRIRRWSIVSHKTIDQEDIIGIVMGTYKVYDKVENKNVTHTNNVGGASPSITYEVPVFNEVMWAVVVFDPIHITSDYVGMKIPIEKLTLLRQMTLKEVKYYKKANTHLRVVMLKGIIGKEIARANKRKSKEAKKKNEDPVTKINDKIRNFIEKEYHDPK